MRDGLARTTVCRILFTAFAADFVKLLVELAQLSARGHRLLLHEERSLQWGVPDERVTFDARNRRK